MPAAVEAVGELLLYALEEVPIDPQRDRGVAVAQALGDGQDIGAVVKTGNQRCSKYAE